MTIFIGFFCLVSVVIYVRYEQTLFMSIFIVSFDLRRSYLTIKMKGFIEMFKHMQMYLFMCFSGGCGSPVLFQVNGLRWS